MDEHWVGCRMSGPANVDTETNRVSRSHAAVPLPLILRSGVGAFLQEYLVQPCVKMSGSPSASPRLV